MRLIAFDTSSFSIFLAALQEGKLLHEEEVAPPEANRQEAVSQLLPSIDRIVKQLGWTKRDLDCIVVVNGPGSFTGIRTAVVTARTIAQALQIPVIAVSSLECLARVIGKEVGIVITAGRGYFFAAAYDQENPVISPVCVTKQELPATLSKQSVWFADSASRAELEMMENREFEIVDLPSIKNPASIAAEIAWDRLSFFLSTHKAQERELKKACIEAFPFETIMPLYLRGASVTIKETHAAGRPATN